jgi:hypothetical protein
MKIQIPANKLAEFITAKTPERRQQIVRQLKNGKKGHPVYYTLFHKPAKRFLIDGASDATNILRLIERLKGRTQSDWYARDSRITTEALRALIKITPELHSLNASFVEPGKDSKTKLEFDDVQVTVTPNLLVHGERGGKPLVGALRFYIAKESTYELGKRGAEIVAVLEYLRLLRLATGKRTPDTELCIVLECFQQRVTKAPAHIENHVSAIEHGCRAFVQLWHQLDEKDAA